MSQAKADEWSHADRGSPWQHKDSGGVANVPADDPMSLVYGLGQLYEYGNRPPTYGANGPEPALPKTIQKPPPDTSGHPLYWNTYKQVTGHDPPPEFDPDRRQTAEGHADGGPIEHALNAAHTIARHPFQMGGESMSAMVPYWARQAAHEDIREAGLLQSEIPGRTDHIPVSVAAGSYVVPADVVAGLGEGNTLAGAKVLNHALKTGPYATEIPHERAAHTLPGASYFRPLPSAPHPYMEPRPTRGEGELVDASANPGGYAGGGVPRAPKGHNIHGQKETVPIVAAGGEYLIDPQTVAFHPALGGGDPNNPDPKKREAALKRGHEVLDEFVKQHRKDHIKTLQKLPGPSK